LLPLEWALAPKFYNQIFAEAFGLDPTDSKNLHSTNTDENDITIPINFCKKYGIKVLNLQNEPNQTSDKQIPNVLFNSNSNNYIFIYTPPKVGSTTLVSSLRVSLGKSFNIIHLYELLLCDTIIFLSYLISLTGFKTLNLILLLFIHQYSK
jgi:hypothetical protein